MEIRIILKSGVDFTIKCEKFTICTNAFGALTEYKITGITENKPIYLDAKEIAAIVRVSNET